MAALLELRWVQLLSISFSHERGRNRHFCFFPSLFCMRGLSESVGLRDFGWGGLDVFSLLFLS